MDGEGGPPTIGDICLDGGRLLAVGGAWPGEAMQVIDVGGRVVSPGFIDLHTHSDVSLLSSPGAISAVEQGITTQQVGLCGFSAAPIAKRPPADSVDDPIFGFPDVPITWSSLSEYRDLLEAARPATNVAMLVGHNTVRREVMGLNDRQPDETDMRAMARAVEEALDAGARGLSTGLTYPPGAYAEREEIVRLAELIGDRGMYHTHMRYARHGQPGAVMSSLQEAIDTANQARVRLNVSHLYPHPGDTEDEAGRLLDKIDAARHDGIDVAFDVTVFTRGGGAFAQQLPRWAKSGGGNAIKGLLTDPSLRRRLFDEMTGPDVPAWKLDWGDRIVVKTASHQLAAMVGHSLSDLAARQGRHPLDVAFDLLLEDPQVWMAASSKRQADLDTMLTHSLAVPITDGLSAHPQLHRAQGLMPKTFGTFPHFFGRYVRDQSVVSLSDGIRRATKLPAERMGLHDRGRLLPGLAADVVVFDPTSIANQAGDSTPWMRPTGVEHVFVNGVHTVSDGAATGRRAGQVL